MPVTASRAVLRQSQLLAQRTPIRHASSTSEAASKGASKGAEAASKASQGLSRATSAAVPMLTNAASSAASALRNVGGRTGKIISFVDSMIPPTLYYSKVGLELGKLVFRGQNMSPPNMATFQSYFQPLLNSLSNPATFKTVASPQAIMSCVRNASPKQIALAGVTTAEVIGFFTVGEIIGRMNIVGYKGEPAHHGH
ncbi:hypothetical protein PHISCL_06647 [Aspergillus sclerotialis]|uniref:Mitochondrial F1F0-ATP synthase g subunit n=1 Tax=Aspergillus sclerotialis TaxID=2070753 RepID=A0A3A2ZDK5_9EURO|nr:hypothetical protein PHISCL_06647 [Aspergillus sclerotialis]